MRFLGEHVGLLMFQVDYLNRRKTGGYLCLLQLFEVFRRGLPNGLRGEYVDSLAEHGLSHVFLQGWYTSPIYGVY